MKGKNIVISMIMILIFGSVKGQKNLDSYFKPTIYYNLDTCKVKSKNVMIPKYKVSEQPLFCKWEELWQRNTMFNVRLRLGSADYVDLLENKVNKIGTY